MHRLQALGVGNVTSPNNELNDNSGSSHASSTSSSLLRGLRGNDQAAWRQAARLYGPLVYGWAIRAGLRPEDSEDVVQEVFRAVVAKLDSFRRDRAGDTFGGRLWTITRNKLGDYICRRRRQPDAAGGSSANERFAQVPVPDEAELDSSGDALGMGHVVQRALQLIRTEFELRTWEAFWMVTIDERPPADVASELGMTLNSVYLAKSRVLRRLREKLDNP